MDEPEEPDDEPVETEDAEEEEGDAELSALAELALCENLSQTSGWAARWSASMAGADAALLWAPDTVHPLFLCIGAFGDGLESILRRSVPRESGIVHDLVRDRSAVALDRADLESTGDPFLRGVPKTIRACVAVPLEAESIVVGLLALFFEETADTGETLQRIEGFLQHAAPALGRALRSERKTVGMLHAIERLTNLYDLSKAFGSTIDTDELATLVDDEPDAVEVVVVEVGFAEHECHLGRNPRDGRTARCRPSPSESPRSPPRCRHSVRAGTRSREFLRPGPCGRDR